MAERMHVLIDLLSVESTEVGEKVIAFFVLC